MPRVAVIIVSYNSQPEIQRALASCRDVPEVIVVDNASSDGTAEWIREHHPQVLLIALSTNVGFGRAINRAASRTQAEVLLLLNPDAWLPTDGCIGQMVDALSESGAWALGLRQVDEAGRLQLAFGGTPTLWAEGVRRTVQRAIDRGGRRGRYARQLVDTVFARPKAVPWVAGSGLLVWRKYFMQVGGFDPGYFLFFEDIDFCLRLRHAGGWILYACHLTLGHSRGQSAGRAPILARQAYRKSQQRFAQTHMAPVARWLIQRWAQRQAMR